MGPWTLTIFQLKSWEFTAEDGLDSHVKSAMHSRFYSSKSVTRTLNVALHFRRSLTRTMVSSRALRPSEAQLAAFAKAYASNRPAIQRTLTSGFVIYIVYACYRGLAGKSSAPSTSKKGKGKERADGQGATKQARVAVSWFTPVDCERLLQGIHRSMPSSTNVCRIYCEL